MRRTQPAELAIAFVIFGLIVYLVLRSSYESLPPLRFFTPLPLAALAIVEFVVARRVSAAVGHRAGARLMSAVSIARCAALGKASALVAAAMLGVAGGVLLRVVPDAGRVSVAGHDTAVGVVLAVCSALLLVAGLLLERAAIDPNAEERRREREEREK